MAIHSDQDLMNLFRDWYVARGDLTSAEEIDFKEQLYNFFSTALSANQTVYGTLGTNGNTTVTSGDLSIATAGKGINIKEGTNARMGLAVLVGGSKAVSTTAVTANSRILVTSNVDGGTPGWLRVSARTAGTSFTITSSSGTDTSSVAWYILEPAS